MFNRLDNARSLTSNQIKIIAAAIVGDMLEFFDYYLIGFVLAFIIKPWHLTFGQSAIILLSSGVGAIPGAVTRGRLADVYGRRKVFIGTIINFSLASGVLAFTSDNGLWFLSIFRFFVGFGVGGLYCVDLPLSQEFANETVPNFSGVAATSPSPQEAVAVASRRQPTREARMTRQIMDRFFVANLLHFRLILGFQRSLLTETTRRRVRTKAQG